MTKVVFVCNSSKIHSYLYLCITSLLKSFSDSQIFFVIDENCKSNSLKFNTFIDYVDHRYSNFILNPFDFVEVTSNDSIKIIDSIDQIDKCDWIILENSNFDYSRYENIANNGIIALDFDCSDLKKSFFKKRILKLSIYVKKSNQSNWSVFSKNLKPERGIKNNVSRRNCWACTL